MNLEFEKIYRNLILFDSKKRYVAHKFEGDFTKGKLDYMGIELKRRDNSVLARRLQRTFLTMLVVEDKPEEALQWLQGEIRTLLAAGTFESLDDFIITGQIRQAEYATPPASVVANERIRGKDPGLVFTLGERVPYCICRGQSPKVSERAHWAEYVKDPANGLQIDVDYYFKTDIQKPFSRILALVYPKKQWEPVLDLYRYPRTVVSRGWGLDRHFTADGTHTARIGPGVGQKRRRREKVEQPVKTLKSFFC